jgi:hypothetical protein
VADLELEIRAAAAIPSGASAPFPATADPTTGGLNVFVAGLAAYSYYHSTGANAGTSIKGAPGTLRALTINTPVASDQITLKDGGAGGAVIAVLKLPASLLNEGPITAIYDVAFATSLYITSTTGSDITVSYR